MMQRARWGAVTLLLCLPVLAGFARLAVRWRPSPRELPAAPMALWRPALRAETRQRRASRQAQIQGELERLAKAWALATRTGRTDAFDPGRKLAELVGGHDAGTSAELDPSLRAPLAARSGAGRAELAYVRRLEGRWRSVPGGEPTFCWCLPGQAPPPPELTQVLCPLTPRHAEPGFVARTALLYRLELRAPDPSGIVRTTSGWVAEAFDERMREPGMLGAAGSLVWVGWPEAGPPRL